MKTTKHFALVALIVLGATLGASTSAWGQHDVPYGPLYCLVGEGDPDFGASGQWAFNWNIRKYGVGGSTDGNGNYFRFYGGTASVTCSGLIPGAWYLVEFASASSSSKQVKADRDGSVSVAFRGETLMWAHGPDWYPGYYVWVLVSRLNPDGTSILVLSN